MLCHFYFAIGSKLCKFEMLLYYKNMSFVTLYDENLVINWPLQNKNWRTNSDLTMKFKFSRGIHIMARYDKIRHIWNYFKQIRSTPIHFYNEISSTDHNLFYVVSVDNSFKITWLHHIALKFNILIFSTSDQGIDCRKQQSFW